MNRLSANWWLTGRVSLLLLLCAEFVAFTLPFNPGVDAAQGGCWRFLLAALKGTRPILIASVSVAVLLSRRELQASLRLVRLEEHAKKGSARPWLALHLGTVSLLALGTALRWRNTSAFAGPAELWLALWGLLGVAALITWSLAALPLRFWQRWISHSLRAFLYGAVVGLSAYVLGGYAQTPWIRFQGSTFWMVALLLRIMDGRPAIIDPKESVLGTSYFSVQITPVCSGFEGIALVCCFLGFYLWFYRHELRFPQALLMVPIGIVAAWMLNALRIAILIVIGGWIPEAGLKGFHSVAGWLFFNLLICGLVWGSWRFGLFTNDVAAKRRIEHRDGASSAVSAAAYLVPLLAIMITTMICHALFPGAAVFYPVQVLAAGLALWLYRHQLVSIVQRASVAALLPGVLAFALWIAFAGGDSALGNIGKTLSGMSLLGAAAWLLFRLIGAVVAMPIAEELAFRGYLTRRFIALEFETIPIDRFTWLSFLGTSLLFGAFHGEWLAGTAVGMIFTITVYRRGVLSDAILAHATSNGLLCAYALAVQRVWF